MSDNVKDLSAETVAKHITYWWGNTNFDLVKTLKAWKPTAAPVAKGETGQRVTPKMMSDVFAQSVNNTDPEHEHLYDHRIAAELLNKLLAAQPAGTLEQVRERLTLLPRHM